ncbi:uncharacterized protein BDZ99DRAFT_571961 [Mytilinidion resinicola]|uniref:Uncharacterized protein n=1 Tax=Mytilinidion resinicola TaxID=574789 RepID=A0A6A6YK24_9PEZI|nr:uncharacterized protein BDZ99DRAFT_571961 [Mytilinidion resinicola]KAF2809161.1 hypothetical protein BDZ99DRAFT_571961 [Mytilinidion resinicola]
MPTGDAGIVADGTGSACLDPASRTASTPRFSRPVSLSTTSRSAMRTTRGPRQRIDINVCPPLFAFPGNDCCFFSPDLPDPALMAAGAVTPGDGPWLLQLDQPSRICIELCWPSNQRLQRCLACHIPAPNTAVDMVVRLPKALRQA